MSFAIVGARRLLSFTPSLLRIRNMSSASTELLINDPKYSWLRELGLEANNPGVFDGSWHAQGNVRRCPSVMALAAHSVFTALYGVNSGSHVVLSRFRATHCKSAGGIRTELIRGSL